MPDVALLAGLACPVCAGYGTDSPMTRFRDTGLGCRYRCMCCGFRLTVEAGQVMAARAEIERTARHA